MRVSEAMSRDVQVAQPNQTIKESAKMMSDMDVGALPVAEGDRLVGMITDRDIAIRQWPKTWRLRPRCAMS